MPIDRRHLGSTRPSQRSSCSSPAPHGAEMSLHRDESGQAPSALPAADVVVSRPRPVQISSEESRTLDGPRRVLARDLQRNGKPSRCVGMGWIYQGRTDHSQLHRLLARTCLLGMRGTERRRRCRHWSASGTRQDTASNPAATSFVSPLLRGSEAMRTPHPSRKHRRRRPPS